MRVVRSLTFVSAYSFIVIYSNFSRLELVDTLLSQNCKIHNSRLDLALILSCSFRIRKNRGKRL